MKDLSQAEQALRNAHAAGDTAGAQKIAAYIREQQVSNSLASPSSSVSKGEAALRGAYYGGIQQPRDVLAAAYANLVGDVPFKEGLDMAKEMSLSGEQGKAQAERPGYFTGGQIGGNIVSAFLPAAGATKAIGAAAPALEGLPIAGNALANLARGIGASQGYLGVPLAGAAQGGISSLMTEGDLSGAVPGALGAGTLSAVGKVLKPISNISKAREGYADQIGRAHV